jgi:hypothetical protein
VIDGAGVALAELVVRWLSLVDRGRLDTTDAVVLALVSPDRSALARAWVTVLDANVLPCGFRSGEMRGFHQLGYVVIFEPEERLSKESAEARWPKLIDEVAALAGRPSPRDGA